MIYYIADPHFSYGDMLEFRPFDNVAHMDGVLVENWNRTVSDDDEVFVIGDISSRDVGIPFRILEQLKGRLHLIRGNHDMGFSDSPLLFDFFETVRDFDEIDDAGRHVLMCHYPIIYNKTGFMVHGHLHAKYPDGFFDILHKLPKVLNACVEVNGYRPVTLTELIENNVSFYGRPIPQKRKSAGISCKKGAAWKFLPIPQKPSLHRPHLFLTGKKHIGKTTVLRRLLGCRDADFHGFFTLRILNCGGASIHMLPGDKYLLPDRGPLCNSSNLLFCRRGGARAVMGDAFERIGNVLVKGSYLAGYTIMDELGPAEGDSPLFMRAILERLDFTAPVYGVIQECKTPFLDSIREHPNVELVHVTKQNRDTLPDMLRARGF